MIAGPDVLGRDRYQLTSKRGLKHHDKFHVSRLRCYPRLLDGDIEVDDDVYYEVDKIVDCRPRSDGEAEVWSTACVGRGTHWRITGRFTEPVTGKVPVNVLLADLLYTLLPKEYYCPVTGVPVLVKPTLLAWQ